MPDPGRAGVPRIDDATGTVLRLFTAPVKGLTLLEHQAVTVGPTGIPGDRRYAVIDERGQLYNGKRAGELVTVVPETLDDPERLRLRFPDGSVVGGEVAIGRAVRPRLYGEERRAHVVEGSFGPALSEWAGRPLRVVRLDAPNAGIDRAELGGHLTLLSSGALAALGAAAGLDGPVDARRFRMSVIIDGVPAHAEDGWIGRSLRIGDVLVRPGGNVGRCAVTTQDPRSGRVDLDTLRLLARTRGELSSSEPLPFGVWAEVLEPGRIRLGDRVVPGDPVQPADRTVPADPDAPRGPDLAG